MFEKEAEEYAKDYEGSKYIRTVDEVFKNGAEYGYNKANEWHYPSKGELPKELADCLVYSEGNTMYLSYLYKGVWQRGARKSFDVIAWQYLPEPPKEV